MLHRINQIIPDLDDFLLPPNAGRSSLNMRFAASTQNTNLSMDLVGGMVELTFNYNIPAGNNKVIGAKEDFESQSVFFALWNYDADTDTNNHGIYRIQGSTVDLVIGGAILNFDEDSDVSIAVIDGKIYWTDNINQPRMVNIEKGIDNLYPSPLEEWMITQIKRPPGLPLDLSPTEFTLYNASIDYGNVFTVETPTQFSYYYVYDNDEESRLAPWSPVNWYLTNVVLGIPDVEYNAYLNGIDIVKQIVFVFRNGNDGVVYAARRVNNEAPFSGIITIPDISILPRSAVPSDITDADFDSVPLLSVSNEIAQNRLDHGNYLIDYDTWNGLTLTLDVEKISQADGATSTWRTFKPNSKTNIGIELLDEWGRKIGVVNSQTVSIPFTTWKTNTFVEIDQTDFDAGNPNWYKDLDNIYHVNWEIAGSFPSWAKYFRIVNSKPLGITQFTKTICKMYYWYVKEGVDYFFSTQSIEPFFWAFSQPIEYIFSGYVFELSSGEPIQYSTGEELYAVIYGSLQQTSNIDDKNGYGIEYKVIKQVNNFLFVKETNTSNILGIGGNSVGDWFFLDGGRVIPSYFDVEFTLKSSVSELYYQNTEVFKVGATTSGTLQGTCYIGGFKKINFATTNTLMVYNYDTKRFVPFPVAEQRTYVANGAFISMNPTNIYSQIWDSDIGQPNVVNENQRQKRILQGIIFSNPLIQGTQINGLSKFNSVDNRQAPLENGPITALVRTSASQREPGVLLAIGKNGVSSFYYDGIQLTNIDGTSNVSTSDRYLASQRPLVGNYGAERLRDICVTPLGTVYYWSQGIRDLIRYSNAGLEQLGETYQFMNYLRDQLLSSDRFMITYDQVTDEVILVGNDANAYVFSERFKTFQGARQYYNSSEVRPERGATLSTRTFFFLEGHIWQMGPNLGAQDNSFFGQVRDPELRIVTNEQPTISKQWNSIKVIGERPITTDLTSEVIPGLPNGRLTSYIDSGWWINRKGDWDAAIRRDVINGGGIMNGKIMESRILISTFAWDANSFVKLNYIEVKSNKSIVQ